MKITKYSKKDGKNYYMFHAYLGIDPLTGKSKKVCRRGFTSAKEAKLCYLRILSEKERKVSNRTYEEVYNDWLISYKNTVRSSTLNKTISYFTLHILPAFGKYNIASITLNEIQKTLNAWSSHMKQYDKLFSYTSLIFEHAIRLQLINTNPCKMVIKPKKKYEDKEAKFMFYTKKELNLFLQLAKEQMSLKWYAFFRLLAYSGMRRGEALALNRSDIKDNEININKNLAKGVDGMLIQPPKTRASKRVIAIDDDTINILNKYLSTHNSDIIFINTKKNYTTFSQPGRMLDSFIKKNNLKRITSHGFRHTHCSILFEAGASIPQVQKRLGHTDIHTTMNIYNHVTKKKEKEAMEKFNKYMKEL
ncbi:MAG: site-specific integrase [Clostridiales bacterium]|nr:MAG: site-specific integrase [Clostridiales bacterium]